AVRRTCEAAPRVYRHCPGYTTEGRGPPPAQRSAMAESKTQREEPWYAGVDRARRRVLYAPFAGWTFDGYETQALVVVVAPALTQLLPAGERGAIGFYSGLAIGLTLLGGGVGGPLGGVVAR